ncbi:serine hydrolase domain-containing protein [Kribbella monticola]|uniref:serine hydrolase domain-containing protein n=1 Tax=Kribbella monticola TaxID=2185285 RepID=UPI000DD43C88|nr:serine hydrolase domain-containing protein [Kribbella monticola]
MSDLQERVQAVIDSLVESGAEYGVQAAVYHRGELVVDAVAGVADVSTGRPVASDTLFYAASAVKGVASTVVHVLVEEGVFGYDTLVTELWPEFGVHGKEGATVRHVLTHSAGVPALPMDLTLEQLCDWDGMCALIADSTPWWMPGERVGYHAVTFGFILGEVVRRATGKPISQVLAEGIGERLEVADELFFGVPAEALGRVARFEDDPAGAAMFASLPADFPLFKSGPRELFPNAAYANNVELTSSDIPSGGVVTARAMARMYAALLGEVDGVRLVSSSRLRELASLSTSGTDELTGGPAQYGLGYTIGQLGMRPVAPSVFGMVGIGGGAAYADTATGLAVAVTKNRFNPVEMNAFDQVWDLATESLS